MEVGRRGIAHRRPKKWHYRVKNTQGKRLPAIVDTFVWKKRMKGKAGIMFDKVVENIWKEIGRGEKR